MKTEQNNFMKLIKNIFLYFSAFIPLFVLLLIKLLVDIVNQNLTFNFLNTFNICLLSVMIVCGIIGILWNTKYGKYKEQTIIVKDSKEITDQYFLQYFSLFVMFAIPLDISFYNEFFIYLIILIFIAIVYINGELFYINPLLNLLGYRFFDTTFVDENGESQSAKIFSKQKLEISHSYVIKKKSNNFAFVEIKKKIEKSRKR